MSLPQTLWSDNFFAGGEEALGRKLDQIVQATGFRYRHTDGKIDVPLKAGPAVTPWIFIRHATQRRCGIWNQIYTQHLDLIPDFCRNYCWKTVIKPKTVEELFMLLAALRGLNLPSKCGIDIRDYTPGPYAGFVYGDSLEEGRNYWARVKETVHRYIGEHVPVILKRGCTEQEQRRASDTWDYVTEEQILLERRLDDIFALESEGGSSHPFNENKTKRMWIRHAMSIGDETWKKIIDSNTVEGLYPHVVQYQTDEAFQKTRSEKGLELEKMAKEAVKKKKAEGKKATKKRGKK